MLFLTDSSLFFSIPLDRGHILSWEEREVLKLNIPSSKVKKSVRKGQNIAKLLEKKDE